MVGALTAGLFALVVAMLLWLIGSTAWSIARPDRRTYPAPDRNALVNRVSAVCGNAINFGIAGLAVLGWDTFALDHWLRFPVGGLLLAAGGYLALRGVFSLGIEQTLGHEGPLVVRGPYRFTRNPQYVGTVLAFTGLNVFCNAALGLAATAVAAVWLLSMPFAEEPWLRERLGARYDEYAARVPRYLGMNPFV